MRLKLAVFLGAILLAGGCAGAQPAKAVDYGDAANWLCRPAKAETPCTSGFDAVAVDAAGNRTPRPMQPPADRAIDCFYVYPTVSNDPGPLADLSFDEAEVRAVRAQAARLGEACRLFAPGYRQMTVAGLRTAIGSGAPRAARLDLETPYADVRDAWRHYLAHENHGRGVVLIGHSQGSRLVRRLLTEEVLGKPAQARLVGAYLAGNGDLTAQDLPALPACAGAGQTGCLIAWSTYREGDGDPARFYGAGAGAICVNPAAPGGGRGMLDAFVPRPAMAPASDPPFVEMKGQASAECVADAQGNVLRVRAEPGRYQALVERLLASGAPGWGLHVLDISLVEGNLVGNIAAQAASWARR